MVRVPSTKQTSNDASEMTRHQMIWIMNQLGLPNDCYTSSRFGRASKSEKCNRQKILGNPSFGSSEFPSSLFDVRRALTIQKDLPLSGFNVRTKQVIYRLDLPNMLSLTCVSRALTSNRIYPESGINIH